MPSVSGSFYVVAVKQENSCEISCCAAADFFMKSDDVVFFVENVAVAAVYRQLKRQLVRFLGRTIGFLCLDSSCSAGMLVVRE